MRRPHESWRPSIQARALMIALPLTMLPVEATTARAEETASPAPTVDTGRPSRSPRFRSPSAISSNPRPDGGWSNLALVALILAACGGIAIASRRVGKRGSVGAMQVVGRVGLSPKHSVYLLRVGPRVLVIGAGPQGPPALIAELDDLPEEPRPTPKGADIR